MTTIRTTKTTCEGPTSQSHAVRPWMSGRSVWLIAIFAGVAVPARGQLFERPLVIQGAKLVTMSGADIEKGSMIIKGGRIQELGGDVKTPFLARTIDATGKTITPGFIDAWSALGRLPGAESKDPTANAWDAFNRYALDDFREAWRHGVTAVYIGALGRGGVTGIGAVVRLSKDERGAVGDPISAEAALCINLDSAASPISRLKTFAAIRKQFRDSLKYREALEDYKEDLKEYLEKLEERREKNAKEQETAKEGEPAPKGEDQPKPKKEPSPPPGPKPEEGDKGKAPGLSGLPAGHEPVEAFGRNGEGEEEGEAQKAADGKGEDGEEKIEKPAEPRPDRKADVLLKAIDHQLPVRVTAHRSADILNALALAEEFNLDVIIEGATDAHLVAKALAEADVPVVLGSVVRPGAYTDDEFRRHRSDAGDILTKAGVRWVVSSGGHQSSASRFTAFQAQLAVAKNHHVPAWLRLVTTEAARLLGLSRSMGRLRAGGPADFVVWSGDPADVTSVVELVVVAGKEVYKAEVAASRVGGGS